MKKILFILLIIPAFILSQDKIAEFEMSYTSKSYEIQIGKKGKGFSLFIDAIGLDALYDEGGFNYNEKQITNFIANLEYAKKKYIEWKSVAIENNVTEIDKKIDVPEKNSFDGYFRGGSNWHFDSFVSPRFKFKAITVNGELGYYLLILSGELKSTSNQFAKADGFALVFANVEEIDDFLSKIKIDDLKAFLNKKEKNNELFN